MRLTLWERNSPAENFGESIGSLAVTRPGNNPLADATVASGLDAAQQKKAIAAAVAVRLAMNGQATQTQATKAVADILSARSDGSGER
jgi:hypothetical protein